MRTCRCFSQKLDSSVTSTLIFSHQAAGKIQKVENCNNKTKQDTYIECTAKYLSISISKEHHLSNKANEYEP